MKTINKALLFLIPVFFATPDIVIGFSVINLRIDDILIFLLLLANFKKIVKFKYHFFIKTQYFLLCYILFSLLLALSFTFHRVSMYEVFRAIGSLPYLIIVPIIFSNIRYRHIFYKGALFGGVIYIASIAYNYNTIMQQAQMLEKYSSLKEEVSFSSLNPNAVASLALILSWMNILGYVETKNKYHFIFFLLILVPFLTLARGSSVGISIALFFLFINSNKNIKAYFIYFTVILISWFIIRSFVSTDLLQSATTVNIETGEGFSGRYTLWAEGLHLVKEAPFLGYGFATENGVYKDKFNGHMAHQILLHYAIELGIIILVIFLISIFLLLKERWELFRRTDNIIYLIQFCLFIGFFISDLSDQLLYFNKYAYIIYSMSTFSVNIISKNSKLYFR